MQVKWATGGENSTEKRHEAKRSPLGMLMWLER